MKYQRGVSLSGLLVWGFILVVVASTGMKIVPSLLEYYKIRKDAQAVVNQLGPDATVADVRRSFDRFADIDQLDFKSDQLDITKDSGQIVIAFAYEKRVPLFANVSLVIDYKGSTGPRGKE